MTHTPSQPPSEEEIHKEIDMMIELGVFEIVRYDENGEPILRLTEVGKELANLEHNRRRRHR